MASPVDTSVKIFTSTMSGLSALIMNGTTGTGIPVLNAVLSDGFDQVTLTSLTVSGGVATAAYSGTHSADVDTVVLIAGVTGPLTALNGEQKITGKPTAGSVTFATAAANGTATGTITMMMASMGWSKVYTGTNKVAYKSIDPAGNGMYLRVDDSDARFMRVIGYETMSDVDTGTGLFPSAAQISGGHWWWRSNTANSTAIPYEIIGDARAFYLMRATSMGSTPLATNRETSFFGDILSYKAGDAFGCCINGPSTSAVWSAVVAQAGDMNISQSAFTIPSNAYMARSYTQIGASVPVFRGSPQQIAHISGSGNDAYGTYPNGPDLSLRVHPCFVTEGTTKVDSIFRGEFPGLWHTQQSVPIGAFDNNDRITATGPLAGRRLNVTRCQPTTATAASTAGVAFIDITGPWAR